MARICPQCGREFLSHSVSCPVCGCAIIEDGIDNSEQARKQRLQQLQSQRRGSSGVQPRQTQMYSRQTQTYNRQSQAQNPPPYTELPVRSTPVAAGPSGLSIAALIFSMLCCLSFIGLVLAIIDLCIKDGKKKICSVIAIIISCLWILFSIYAIATDDKPKSIGNAARTYFTGEQTAVSSTPSRDTFGLMETAEMNNVQVTMTNYRESYGSDWFSPDAGNVFVFTEFEIVNNSGSEVAVSSIASFDAYADGYLANYSFEALAENDQGQLDGSISPGKKMRGWIGYEVPSGWSNLEIHFKHNIWSNNKFKFEITK